MRQIVTVILLILLSSGVFAQTAKNVDLIECNNRIKNNVQALELWANDHKNIFPSSQEYQSAEFDKYLKKIDPVKVAANKLCPSSKEKFVYESLNAGKSYAVRCPHPQCYGLSFYYYSRDKGFVKGENVAVKKYEPKAQDKKAVKTSETAKKSEPTKPAAKPETAKKPAATKPAVKPETAKKPEPTKPAVKPETAKKPEPPQPPTIREVTKDDEVKITDLIKELYNAYAEKDVSKVLELQKRSIESSAIDYEKQGKGSAEDVREAFKSATEEIINHKAFKMLPLNLTDLTFQQRGNYCRVTSVVPIIATDRLEIEDNGKYFFVRLRIAEFIFAPEGDKWVIENMYLY